MYIAKAIASGWEGPWCSCPIARADAWANRQPGARAKPVGQVSNGRKGGIHTASCRLVYIMGERNDVWKENTRFLVKMHLNIDRKWGFPNMSVAEEKDKEKELVSDRASLSPQSVLRLSRSRLGDTVLFNRINTGTEADRELWYYIFGEELNQWCMPSI